jgi:hypothetical protein
MRGGLDEIDTCIICMCIGDGVLETDGSLYSLALLLGNKSGNCSLFEAAVSTPFSAIQFKRC